MDIAVAGMGYVGLVASACFASKGHTVTCYDIDPHKIALLQKGVVPFYEEGLEPLLQKGLQQGKLHFTPNKHDLLTAPLCFLAIPAPHLEEEILDYARQAKAPLTLAIKSTTAIGFMKKMEAILQDSPHITLLHNPEFLREGSAIQDFLFPARIVIGTKQDPKNALLEELYSAFTSAPILWMDYASAEMVKCASNAMLACRVSFINEIAQLCSLSGADIHSVALGIGSDPRIGKEYLEPGIGFGGSCLPKDLALLQDFSPQEQSPLLHAISAVNNQQIARFLQAMQKHFAPLGGLKGKKIALLGVSFKPGTDDTRNSPALALLKLLLQEGAEVPLYDPKVADPSYAEDPYEAAKGAHAICITTNWPEFATLNWQAIKASMEGSALFDGRSQLNAASMQSLGFTYFSAGTL